MLYVAADRPPPHAAIVERFFEATYTVTAR